MCSTASVKIPRIFIYILKTRKNEKFGIVLLLCECDLITQLKTRRRVCNYTDHAGVTHLTYPAIGKQPRAAPEKDMEGQHHQMTGLTLRPIDSLDTDKSGNNGLRE